MYPRCRFFQFSQWKLPKHPQVNTVSISYSGSVPLFGFIFNCHWLVDTNQQKWKRARSAGTCVYTYQVDCCPWRWSMSGRCYWRVGLNVAKLALAGSFSWWSTPHGPRKSPILSPHLQNKTLPCNAHPAVWPRAQTRQLPPIHDVYVLNN